MSTTELSVQLKFAYGDATSRTIKFNGVDSSALPDVKDKVKAINMGILEESLPAFTETFVSSTGAPVAMISEAKIIAQTSEIIYQA